MKDLPKGYFVFFGQLAPEITEDDLSNFFYSKGLDVGPERIEVKTNHKSIRNCAVVSFCADDFCMLLTWAFGEDNKIEGCEIKPSTMFKTKA